MAINVRILRGVQTGLTGMSGLVALSTGVAACATERSEDGSVGEASSALTLSDAGTGVFSLQVVYGFGFGVHWEFRAKNSVDEYVRVGQKLSFNLPANLLWEATRPEGGSLPDVERLKQLSAEVKVIFVEPSGVTSESTIASTGVFTGTQNYNLTVATGEFVVPPKTATMRFELRVTDALEPARLGTRPTTGFNEIPVIGADIPGKTLLLDTSYETRRQRILEGGKPVAGANLAIVYTDWRANALVDSSSIDRIIGTQTRYGRFGNFQGAIEGKLEYEVSYAVAIDGAWQPERLLATNKNSRLLPSRGPSGQLSFSERTAYEGLLAVPEGAQRIEAYFHVKTYLVANYDGFFDVTSRRYGNNARMLVREAWDNENGVYADNYEFGTEPR